MSDENEKRVRRMRHGDRRDALPRTDLQFPADDGDDDAPGEFDLDSLPLPEEDSEALSALSNLPDEAFRPPVITPREERMPLLTRPDEPAPEAVPAAAEVPVPARPRRGWLYNLLTLLFLLLTVASVIWVALVWMEPQGSLNPFPPPVRYAYITATPPGAAQSALPTPDESGQIVIVATQTPPPGATPTESLYPFVVQEPIFYAPNENDLGCNWWSIAGTVTDAEGQALDGYRVRITGEGLDEVAFSGAARAFGEGGYELPLVGAPREADFVVQLFSPQEAPLSEPIPVTTRADCDGNITVVNFVQVR